MNGLKKNDAVKGFVTTTMMGKLGEIRTIAKILEVLAERYDRNTSEKTLGVMRKISGDGFKAEESVDKMIDRFEDMVLEVKKVKIEERLEYALGLQFLERVEKSGKINQLERKLLRDILEDKDGNPREGDIVEQMKKELKRMKVVENREEPFEKKEEKTYYMRNGEGNRSRRDNWIRSSLPPGFYRTASRNNYVRDNSKFRREYNKNRSQSGGRFAGRNNS